jgi:hypothetical protein
LGEAFVDPLARCGDVFEQRRMRLNRLSRKFAALCGDGGRARQPLPPQRRGHFAEAAVGDFAKIAEGLQRDVQSAGGGEKVRDEWDPVSVPNAAEILSMTSLMWRVASLNWRRNSTTSWEVATQMALRQRRPWWMRISAAESSSAVLRLLSSLALRFARAAPTLSMLKTNSNK